MKSVSYIAYIHERVRGEWHVRFQAVPEAMAKGASYEEALIDASRALSAALAEYLKQGRPFPKLSSSISVPPEFKNFDLVDVPVEIRLAARGLLVDSMRQQGLSKIRLAQRMNKDEKVIRRIISGQGATLDLTLSALEAVGVRTTLAVDK